MDDALKKGLCFLFLSVGMMIFAAVLILKVEWTADKVRAETKLYGAELDWEGYLYRQAAQKVMEEKGQ